MHFSHTLESTHSDGVCCGEGTDSKFYLPVASKTLLLTSLSPFLADQSSVSPRKNRPHHRQMCHPALQHLQLHFHSKKMLKPPLMAQKLHCGGKSILHNEAPATPSPRNLCPLWNIHEGPPLFCNLCLNFKRDSKTQGYLTERTRHNANPGIRPEKEALTSN